MPDELFVNSECYHSKAALSMMAHAPTVLRNNMKITHVDYKNAPPAVTAVPTLVKQNGTVLVGAQVFDYLKKGRKDPHFPHTDVDEHFTFGGSKGMFRTTYLIIYACVIVLIVAYGYFADKWQLAGFWK
jgi:hypothetical protein